MEDPSESLSLDEELFGSLEKAIALAVQHAEQNGAASSSAPDGTSVEEIAALLQLAELAYTNEEWVEVVKIYTQLQEMGIDLPPFADARLALSFSFLNDPAQALIHAVASYENNPAEAAAYIAMARCCVLMVSLPKTGLRWLQLAAQAINIPHSVLKETKAEIEEIAIQSEHEEQYAIPYLKQQHVYERISENTEFASLVDMQDLQSSLEIVQSDLGALPEVRGKSLSMAAMLKILWNDPDVLLPRVLSYEETAALFQSDCPLHILGNNLFAQIVSLLPLSSISALQSTCKLHHYWANRPSTWQEVFCRTWEPLQQVTYGAPLLPYMWKYHFKTRQCILASSKAVFETMVLTQRADPSDIEAMRKRVLTQIAHTYRSATGPLQAASMVSQFTETIDVLATSTTPDNALTLVSSPAFLTVAVTSLARVGFHSSNMETQTAILALICLALAGGPQIMKSLLLLGVKTLCSNLMFGPLHEEACALYAVLKLAETNFGNKCFTPVICSTFWCANFSDERLTPVVENLNGIWRHFMFYDDFEMRSVIDLGASKLSFDIQTNAVNGSGSDTIGPFTIDNVLSQMNPRSGQISIVRKYANVSLEFVGVIHPFGFSGYFHRHQDGPSTEPPTLLGYWFAHQQYKTITNEEWKVFVADMKARAAKRPLSKFSEPWKVQSSPLSMLSQDLREMTRSTFIMSLPSAASSDIQIAETLYKPASDEEMKAFGKSPLLRGPGESGDKFERRGRIHSAMMMELFDKRTTFALQKLDEVENDLQALETQDVSSPAILSKWHDYLCLYTFDNYAISSGVEGLCQFFKLVRHMAQDIRSKGGDPTQLFAQPSSLDTEPMDKLPENWDPRMDSDVESEDIDADEEAAKSAVQSSSQLKTPAPVKTPAKPPTKAPIPSKNHTTSSTDRDSESEEEEEYEEEEDDNNSEDGEFTTKQRTKRRQTSGVGTATTLMVAAAVVTAVGAGVYALTKYFTGEQKPKSKK